MDINFRRQQLLNGLGIKQLPAMTVMDGSSAPVEDMEVAVGTISVWDNPDHILMHLSNTIQCPSEHQHQHHQPDQKFPDKGIPIRTLTVSLSPSFSSSHRLTHLIVGSPQVSRLWQQRQRHMGPAGQDVSSVLHSCRVDCSGASSAKVSIQLLPNNTKHPANIKSSVVECNVIVLVLSLVFRF